ncbi:MAG: glycosyltransferase [Bacteroidota bacterium]|nr:glycosyltransferase [Bacteroidota bacterium]
MQPKVSIIIPAYNAEKWISQALESVISQTWNNIEIIIVNDGSTDGTKDIIQSFNDERIRYFSQENKGQCAASNAGLKQATGDYIKFFDADDIMNAEHVEEQLKKLNGSKTSIASCAWGKFYNGNPSSASIVPETVWKDMIPIDWLKAALSQKRDMMGAYIWMIPKEVLKKSGGWDERLSLNNDFEFSIRLLLNADKILFTPGATIFYRSGIKGTLSKKITRQAYYQAFLSTQSGCSYLLNADPGKEMKLICANRYQDLIFQMYPYHPEITREMEAKIKEWGGSNLKMEGSPIIQALSRVFGWKNAKKIRLVFYRLGYLKLIKK